MPEARTFNALQSWKDGETKSAIFDFVAEVTKKGGPDYRDPAERIAVFDNDGTLWCEQPMPVQAFFVRDRIAELAIEHPSIKGRQPFKAFLEYDRETINALGKEGLFALAFAVHAGVSVAAFERIAAKWMQSARHPWLRRPCSEAVYQPMLELLDFLRSANFKTFIVSGGGSDFIRSFAEQLYGVPPEQVIGSTVKTRFEAQNGHCELMKLAEVDSFDDRETKVENIGLHIGRRPILAFGNSDGDLAMMRYTASGPGRTLALLLHHDDGDREVAYDREFRLSPLAEALDRAAEFRVHVVSMKDDWQTVFTAHPH